jgi:hypothetical protein
MQNRLSLHGTAAALLLAATFGFAQLPATMWKTNDTNFVDMWNKETLDTNTFWPYSTNWSVANAGTDSAIIRTNGAAINGTTVGWTNLTWKAQTDSSQKNFEVRFTWRMVNPSGNSGFTKCGGLSQGFRVAGPQIDLGPTYTGDIWNSFTSGNLGPTAPTACAVATSTFQDLAMRVRNDTMTTFYYTNGFAAGTRLQCTTFKLVAANHVAATSPGLIALQYETTRVNEFKNIQIRNLDAVQATSINGVPQLAPSFYTLRAGSRSLNVGVSAAGRYAVEVSDLSGKVLHRLRGEGSSAKRDIQLKQAGLYVVKITASQGTALRKVMVR